MKKKKINKVLAGGMLCIFAALCLIVYNCSEEQRAQQEAKAIQQKLENEIGVQTEDTGNVLINNREYCGLLEIPVLSIKLPVQSELTAEGLKNSPCRYAGWVDTGNLVLAGHNYKSHFGNLNQLKPGDEIYFTTTEGSLYRYTVSNIEILDATDTEEMMSGEWDLSLFTCTLSRTSRVTVRCKRSDED